MPQVSLRILCVVLLCLPVVANAARPGCLVIAHRGASGYLPEHTLPAYRLAIQLGADFIEPDLVLTRDGTLVARHEPGLDLSTDVASRPRFAARSRWIERFGKPVTDWFVEDFTLAELRELRARETRPELRPGNTAFDGQFGIPTLTEIVALLREEERRTGRVIGVYPELKEPDRFRNRGLDPEGALLAELEAHGLDGPDSAVLLQSFDADSLKRLAERTELLRIQLVGAAAPGDTALPLPDFSSIATYAQGIGAPKSLILGSAAFMTGAREAGLIVHGWTFRAENAYLEPAFRRGETRDGIGDLTSEIRAALATGMSGLFTDQPDVGRAVCDAR